MLLNRHMEQLDKKEKDRPMLFLYIPICFGGFFCCCCYCFVMAE